MSKKFVIGDRTKDEWISVLDTEKKKLEFTNHLSQCRHLKANGFSTTRGHQAEGVPTLAYRLDDLPLNATEAIVAPVLL